MLLTLIILVALAAAAFVFMNKAKAKPIAKTTKKSKIRHKDRQPDKYQAVSIHSSGTLCKAAQDISSRLYLSAEAPLLPLADCSNGNCSCRYKRHEDRRQNQDRRWSYGMAHSLNDGLRDEKRKNPKQDRRAKA